MATEIKIGMRVEAGEGEDRDTGKVVSITGDRATVAWDSGVTTPVPVVDLSPTTERWSGGHRVE